jgi:hypothetical protein
MIEYLLATLARNIPIEIRTIVPPGDKLRIYDIVIPDNTENTPTKADINAVFLNPFPNIIAVMFGITVNEEISSTPTNRIDVITVILARTTKR